MNTVSVIVLIWAIISVLLSLTWIGVYKYKLTKYQNDVRENLGYTLVTIIGNTLDCIILDCYADKLSVTEAVKLIENSMIDGYGR